MIDYLLAFTDQPTAQADPVVGKFWSPPDDQGDPGTWDMSQCIPGVVVSAIATGLPVDGNWRILIRQMQPNATLASHPDLVMSADPDLASAGQPPSVYVLSSAIPTSEWPALQVAPVFTGSGYQFGSSV